MSNGNAPTAANKMSKTIDFAKPVQTRDGRRVTIFRTDIPHEQSVVGLVEGSDYPCSWGPDGRFFKGIREDRYDLENVPQPPVKRKVWLNIYESDGKLKDICFHQNRVSAEIEASSNVVARVEIEIEYTPGQGL